MTWEIPCSHTLAQAISPSRKDSYTQRISTPSQPSPKQTPPQWRTSPHISEHYTMTRPCSQNSTYYPPELPPGRTHLRNRNQIRTPPQHHPHLPALRRKKEKEGKPLQRPYPIKHHPNPTIKSTTTSGPCPCTHHRWREEQADKLYNSLRAKLSETQAAATIMETYTQHSNQVTQILGWMCVKDPSRKTGTSQIQYLVS